MNVVIFHRKRCARYGTALNGCWWVNQNGHRRALEGYRNRRPTDRIHVDIRVSSSNCRRHNNESSSSVRGKQTDTRVWQSCLIVADTTHMATITPVSTSTSPRASLAITGSTIHPSHARRVQDNESRAIGGTQVRMARVYQAHVSMRVVQSTAYKISVLQGLAQSSQNPWLSTRPADTRKRTLTEVLHVTHTKRHRQCNDKIKLRRVATRCINILQTYPEFAS